MRLTNDDLKEIARMIDEGYGPTYIATKFNYNGSNMKKIIRRYKEHGLNGIIHKKAKRFSINQKIEIINRYYAGESENSLAIEINVSCSVIRQWIKKYEQLGYNGLIDNRGKPGVSKMGRPKKEVSIKQQTPLTDSEREELNELRRKTYYQQMEIDCLKKIQALVQQRQNRQTKKKQ